MALGATVSDYVLSVIPASPTWQPSRPAGHRLADLLRTFAPEADTVEIHWHDKITVIDAGDNLVRITCPSCRQEIPREWYAGLVEGRQGDGFNDLATTAPCCGAATTLDVLGYHWPVGFARFEVAVRNGLRDRLPAERMALLARALRHPVRQILAQT
jgi:hypothetical protein